MKQVFLLGDSIRVGSSKPTSPGYGNFVKENLEGIAEVVQPKENCQFTVYTYRHIRDWKNLTRPEDVAVVHWNNGLWDMARIDIDTESVVPIDIYKSYLKRIYVEIRYHFPKAKIIFALSTAVMEKEFGNTFFRNNATIREYNAAAREVLEPLGVVINDLYTLSSGWGRDMYDDKTHPGLEADRLLAAKVTEEINKLL